MIDQYQLKELVRRRSVSVGVGLFLVLLGIYVFSASDKDLQFPAIGTGAFVGDISGIVGTQDQPVTFYLERISRTNALLAVLLVNGWKPQVISMQRKFDAVDADQETLTEDIPLEPITIAYRENVFTLTGDNEEGILRGAVWNGKDVVGRWKLRTVRADVLNEAAELLTQAPAQLQEWLVLKVQYDEARKTQDALSTKLAALVERQERLETFVGDTVKLKRRARKRQEELRAQLATLRLQRKESVDGVKRLVSELDLLKRITKRGKAVDLARRLTAREEKWYRANWKVGEDSSGLEEALSATSNINLGQLERQHQKARQRRTLQLQLQAEQKRITQLQRRIQQAETTEAETTGQDEVGEDNKSIWNRLWGRIR